MATIVTSSIGSGVGRTYSTYQAWEDDSPVNLIVVDQVWKGECYNDSEFTGSLNISGITSDSTRYVWLTTAAGESIFDVSTNPLNYDQSLGVGISVGFGTSEGSVLNIGTGSTIVEKIQWKASKGSLYQGKPFSIGLSSKLKDCLIDINMRASNGYVLRTRSSYGSSPGLAYNVLIINRTDRSSDNSYTTFRGEGGTFKNCGAVIPSGLSNPNTGTSFFAVIYTPIVKNCYSFGFSTDFGGAWDSSNSDYNASDSINSPGANSLDSLVYADQFVSTTNDWSLKSGSALKDSGNTDAAVPQDIFGTVREAALLGDIGPHELVDIGGTTFFQVLFVVGSSSSQIRKTLNRQITLFSASSSEIFKTKSLQLALSFLAESTKSVSRSILKNMSSSVGSSIVLNKLKVILKFLSTSSLAMISTRKLSSLSLSTLTLVNLKLSKLLSKLLFVSSNTLKGIHKLLSKNLPRTVGSNLDILKMYNKVLGIFSNTSTGVLKKVEKQLRITSNVLSSIVKFLTKVVATSSTTLVTLSRLKVILQVLEASSASLVNIVKRLQIGLFTTAVSLLTPGFKKSIQKVLGSVLVSGNSQLLKLKVLLKELFVIGLATPIITRIRVIIQNLLVLSSSSTNMLRRLSKRLIVLSLSSQDILKSFAKILMINTSVLAELSKLKLSTLLLSITTLGSPSFVRKQVYKLLSSVGSGTSEVKKRLSKILFVLSSTTVSFAKLIRKKLLSVVGSLKSLTRQIFTNVSKILNVVSRTAIFTRLKKRVTKF